MKQKIISSILAIIIIILIVVCFSKNIEHFDESDFNSNKMMSTCEKIQEKINKEDHIGVIKPKDIKIVVPFDKDDKYCSDGDYYDFGDDNLNLNHDLTILHDISSTKSSKQFNRFYFRPSGKGKEYIFNCSKTDGDHILSLA